MDGAQFRESLITAGIITKSGTLTQRYKVRKKVRLKRAAKPVNP